VRDVHPCCVFMDAWFVLFRFCLSTCVSAGVCSSCMFGDVWCVFYCTSLLFRLHVYAFAFQSMVHCGGAFEPGTSGLPYYCTPLVTAPDVIGARAVWRQNTKNKNKCIRLIGGGLYLLQYHKTRVLHWYPMQSDRRMSGLGCWMAFTPSIDKPPHILGKMVRCWPQWVWTCWFSGTNARRVVCVRTTHHSCAPPLCNLYY